MAPVFEIDGEQFQVDVVCLERELSYPQMNTGGTTMDGLVYRDTMGPYCHYTMKIRARPGHEEDLDQLWEYLLLPGKHNYYLPYGHTMFTQAMYVTGSKQALVYTQQGTTRWGELTLQLTAAEPRSAS